MARSGRSGGHDRVDIPSLPAPLIGRQRELAAGRELLAGGARLVTLTGPPGVGKTSLALALGADQGGRFADGAAMVDLAPVADPSLVGPTIADTLGASGRRRPVDRLVAMLRRRELLLILDNFEQVVAAAPVVSELLVRCPGLTILATSRISLRLRWEHELPVPPLGLPDPAGPLTAAAIARAPAVRLFVERARAVGPSFALTDRNASAVARVCARLDGLPLAIELAAARVRVLAPGAMLRQLSAADGHAGDGAPGAGQVLSLLTDGPRDLPARQQTLRSAIAWSHALLDPAEQRLFRRLAVFSGGSTFDAVERVCEATWTEVASLVEKSLLRLESGDDDTGGEARADGRPPRVRMLELVREYALEQLQASGEADAIGQRHVRYFVELAEQAGPRLFGREQDDWLTRLDQERDNLLSAARRATSTSDGESVLRIGAALFRFWRAHGEHVVVQELVEGVLAVAPAAPALPASVRTLHDAGELARIRGSYAEAHALYTRSLDIAQNISDGAGELDALRGLCFLAGTRGQYAELDRLRGRYLATFGEQHDSVSSPRALRELGMIDYYLGDHARARQSFERSLALAQQSGDQREIADSSYGLALTYHVEGAYERARHLYEGCLRTDRAHGYRASEGAVLNNLGHLAVLQGDQQQAQVLIRDSLLAGREAGAHRRLAFTLSAVAGLVAVENEPERALRFDSAGQTALDLLGASLAPGMRALYDQPLRAARDALGQDRAEAAEEAGRSMSLEQAVDEALAWLDEVPDEGHDAIEPGRTTGPPRQSSAPAHDDRSISLDPGIGQGEGGQATILRRPASAGPGAPDRLQQTGELKPLTPREREVASLIARGYSNRQIAEALVVSEGTAANYVQRVLNRLGFHNRTQVAAWAVEHGLQTDRTRPRD